MKRNPRITSRAEFIAGVILGLGVLLVLLSGFSLGARYLEGGPATSVDPRQRLFVALALFVLGVGVIWNLYLRRRT